MHGPTPSPTPRNLCTCALPPPQAQAAETRLRAETGKRAQARLTAHRQCGSLAGGNMVSHVTFSHEGANPQLLRGFRRPPQAGAAGERRKRGDALHPYPEVATF